MKKNILLYITIGTAIMIGCSEDKESGLNGRIPINLGYTVLNATETRAATDLNNTYLAKDDKITVKVSEHSQNSFTDYTYLVVNNTGKMIPASSTLPTYPDNKTVDIVAYYPSTAGTSFSIMADQTSDDNYRVSDLLFASKSDQGAQASAVELQFAHQMAKIIVNASAAEGITINNVTLKNIKPTVTFSQTAAVDYSSNPASGTPVDILMSNLGAAVIPAQSLSGAFLVISTSAGDATYSLASSKSFEAGHQYTLNITVSAAAIGTTSTISGWTGDGTVTVNASVPLPYGVLTTLSQLQTCLDNHIDCSNYIGTVIATDGYLFSSKATATSAGKTAYAMICYLGSGDNITRGLAIALDDAGTCTFANIALTISTWTTGKSISNASWRAPSVQDWRYIFEGCGGENATTSNDFQSETFYGRSYDIGQFRTYLQALGSDVTFDTDIDSYYQTTDSNESYHWFFNFGSWTTGGDNPVTYTRYFGSFAYFDNNLHVRAVLAF